MSKAGQDINNQKQFAEIVQPLLNWYDENARILPWRENTEPYRVWVSEIMLQQTRVEAVKPYFERFMEQLPTIESLAEVEEEVLLKLWEGLGYYARVRNLQKAAKMICRDFAGIFPNSYENILLLPGIGPYTAGAISSISFGKPIPAVDGNVLRVITRLTENYQDIAGSAIKEEITAALKEIYPLLRSGDFTQGLMELGAVICTPNGIPKCDLCPLSHLCRAYSNHTQMELPVKGKKPSRRQEVKTVLLLCFEDKIAVRKRGEKGVLRGLWEFPNVEDALSPEGVTEWLEDWGISVRNITKSVDTKHIFTHVEWRMSSYLVDCETDSPEFLWVTRDTLDAQIALPSAFKKFCGMLWQ